ncbi:MAG: NAD(P)H-hydrate dehydratase [Clostridiales bacterium]|nr:NAD(P)H-hydrate dehydratase [Clostridiales bacterium]
MKTMINKQMCELEAMGIPVPIDSSVTILDAGQIKNFYPKRARNSHKGTYGSCNIVAGSKKYAGAAVLSLKGALRSGCGYVKLTSCEYVKNLLIPKLPQVIYLDELDLTSQAIAIGMGMGATQATYDAVKYLIKNYVGSLIIDADGLNALSEYGIDILKEKTCKVILTPHAKEFSRLTKLRVEDILDNPVEISKEFSKKYGVTLLLKGAASIICEGDRVALNTMGTTALSKGGSGDILSGFMCGCLARGLAPFDAVSCAAYTLGVAAEIASEEKTDYCATADDIIKNLHLSVKRLTSI